MDINTESINHHFTREYRNEMLFYCLSTHLRSYLSSSSFFSSSGRCWYNDATRFQCAAVGYSSLGPLPTDCIDPANYIWWTFRNDLSSCLVHKHWDLGNSVVPIHYGSGWIELHRFTSFLNGIHWSLYYKAITTFFVPKIHLQKICALCIASSNIFNAAYPCALQLFLRINLKDVTNVLSNDEEWLGLFGWLNEWMVEWDIPLDNYVVGKMQ